MKVCLCMIVKNEGHCIADALNSVKHLIDYWVISDTGSTDNTKDVIRETLAGIPGDLVDIPFKNYGYNRTEVFKLANDKADFMLVLDADDVLHAKELKLGDADSYEIEIRIGSYRYNQLRLFNCKRVWTYRGAVHEHPYSEPTPWTTFPLKNVHIESFGTGDTSKNPDKYLNHVKMLMEDIENNPECDISRSTFYLAQSYNCAGDADQAIKNYKIRVAMGPSTNPQEVYFSYYQMGNLNFGKEIYGPAVTNYLLAHNEDPTRAEPLAKLCELFYKMNRWNLGVEFGTLAIKCKLDTEKLFPEPEAYGPKTLDFLSVCAFYAGKKPYAKTLMKRLLKQKLSPEDRERVTKNLAFL